MGVSVPDTVENLEMCRCGGCPTFEASVLSVGFFCARGKARETAKQSGCLCPTCQVFNKHGLKKGYFCLNGKSADT
jgi:hypothetical protein